MKTSTDTEIWKAIKNDDEKAFSILFYRYSSRIYSSSYSYIHDKEVCEQIVHDIFLTIWTNRKTLEINSFKAYLTSAARYSAYKYVTKNNISPLSYKEDIESLTTSSHLNDGYTNIAYEELEAKLDSHLKNLPRRCQEIFIMSRKQLLTNDEIASRLGISKRSVENQITHALKYLRISLKDLSVVLIFAEIVITH